MYNINLVKYYKVSILYMCRIKSIMTLTSTVDKTVSKYVTTYNRTHNGLKIIIS